MKQLVTVFALFCAAVAAAEPMWLIRVGLVSMGPHKHFAVSSPTDFAVFDAETHRKVADVKAGKVVLLSAEGGLVTLDGRRFKSVYYASEGGSLVLHWESSSRAYRGYLHFRATGEALCPVNELALDQYLAGVVPSEISASSPPEALKAQAVASRSYAIRKIGRFKSEPWDVEDTVKTQAYKGAEREDARSTAAVYETRNQLVTYGGRVADAVYGANSGGVTEAVQDVWGGLGEPYLISIVDADAGGHYYAEGTAHMRWHIEFSGAELAAKLASSGRPIGEVMGIVVTRRTPSGRAASVLFNGTAGQTEIKGNDLRWVLGVDRLRSAWFEASSTLTGWRFDGRGWGHGVGLCQDGARGRARAGQTYRQILAAYFPGASLTTFRDEPLKLSSRSGALERARYIGPGR